MPESTKSVFPDFLGRYPHVLFRSTCVKLTVFSGHAAMFCYHDYGALSYLAGLHFYVNVSRNVTAAFLR